MAQSKPQPTPGEPLPPYRAPEQMLWPCRTCGQMVLKCVLPDGQVRWLTPALGYEHVCKETQPCTPTK